MSHASDLAGHGFGVDLPQQQGTYAQISARSLPSLKSSCDSSRIYRTLCILASLPVASVAYHLGLPDCLLCKANQIAFALCIFVTLNLLVNRICDCSGSFLIRATFDICSWRRHSVLYCPSGAVQDDIFKLFPFSEGFTSTLASSLSLAAPDQQNSLQPRLHKASVLRLVQNSQSYRP